MANIQNAEGAYTRGGVAYSKGKTESDNPYPLLGAKAPLHWKWLEGWRDAVRGDPLLDDDEKQTLLNPGRPVPPHGSGGGEIIR